MTYAFCPDCSMVSGVRPVRLDLVEPNYSGSDIDIMVCPKCCHVFSVSYAVDKITRLKRWEAGI
jgi:hypothetical protein